MASRASRRRGDEEQLPDGRWIPAAATEEAPVKNGNSSEVEWSSVAHAGGAPASEHELVEEELEQDLGFMELVNSTERRTEGQESGVHPASSTSGKEPEREPDEGQHDGATGHQRGGRDMDNETFECQDDPAYSLKFSGNQYKGCGSLQNLCMSSPYARDVQRSCQKTCGACDVPMINDETQPCQDHPRLAKPVITAAHEPVECSHLLPYCTAYLMSRYIRTKCPDTCGLCTSLGTWKEDQGASDPNEQYAFQNPYKVGCSRRRRWGYCFVRRRA